LEPREGITAAGQRRVGLQQCENEHLMLKRKRENSVGRTFRLLRREKSSRRSFPLLSVLAAAQAAACGGGDDRATPPGGARPSILLVTLDTTRSDAIGPESTTAATPAFNALAARGRRFRQAYATAPETLPSHASMLTGLYPAGHGIHENARRLSAGHALLAEALQRAGYRTSAFVSAFVLDRRFGLERGFGVYDDEMAGGVERSARATTDRAIADLSQAHDGPRFMWVHYFDPHAPYEPPEPYRARRSGSAYHGEIEAMDAELGRLVEAFERSAAGAPAAIIVAADHGEGLGDHGESQHGHLAYQSTMHVPLVIAGPGVDAGPVDPPVSTRRVFHTILDWAGLGGEGSLRGAPPDDVVLGEAMRPFLSYGWQPQVMAVAGRQKAILTDTTELYDVIADPGETRDLSREQSMPAAMRTVAEDYPIPNPRAAASAAREATAEDRQKLASLGYVSASASPVVRRDAPRPVKMTGLFDTIERASALFVAERYVEAIPLLEQIRRADPNNLDATLRLATAWSMRGQRDRAMQAFRQAAALAPQSIDVKLYVALHEARGPGWADAAPLLEQVLEGAPDRVPAIEALAAIRERQGRLPDVLALRERLYALRAPSPVEAAQLGLLAMRLERTQAAIAWLERARAAQGATFRNNLELGVLYLADRRFVEARDALDRIPASHPEYPMALFKRAQVSVLLNEPDKAARIARAREHADETTRALIAAERLFR
jgi:arylsulfatase A-like enzyme/tetratricopeptide (TPR) repeat protein